MIEFFNTDPIAATPEPVKKSTVAKRGALATVLCISLVCLFSFYKKQSYLNEIVVASKPSAPQMEQLPLRSEIPAWTVGSLAQAVQPPPLKSVLDWGGDPEEEALESLVVMDKVVVIPKKIEQPTLVSVLTPIPTFKVQSINGFTIQLVATQNLKEIKRFISLHKLGAKVKIRKSLRENKTWFIVTMGEYQDYNQARQAIIGLSSDLALNKPWVRRTSIRRGGS